MLPNYNTGVRMAYAVQSVVLGRNACTHAVELGACRLYSRLMCSILTGFILKFIGNEQGSSVQLQRTLDAVSNCFAVPMDAGDEVVAPQRLPISRILYSP